MIRERAGPTAMNISSLASSGAIQGTARLVGNSATSSVLVGCRTSLTLTEPSARKQPMGETTTMYVVRPSGDVLPGQW
jgi:hypothetical protein